MVVAISRGESSRSGCGSFKVGSKWTQEKPGDVFRCGRDGLRWKWAYSRCASCRRRRLVEGVASVKKKCNTAARVCSLSAWQKLYSFSLPFFFPPHRIRPRLNTSTVDATLESPANILTWVRQILRQSPLHTPSTCAFRVRFWPASGLLARRYAHYCPTANTYSRTPL